MDKRKVCPYPNPRPTPGSQCSYCYQEKEIQRLQMFLMKNFQGQLDGTKGAVENAIRLLKRGEISEDKTA